jgi:cell division protein FtsQ
MARSLAGLLGRPLAPAMPRRGGRVPSGRPASRGARRRAIGARWRWITALTLLARGCLELLARRRRLRIALVALLLAGPLLAGGWLWLRDSSLVSVQHVRIRGLQGAEAPQISAALTEAAHHMSTLDVRVGSLRAAVAPFAVVRDLRVTSSFPHGLGIWVIEQPPVAALVAGGTRTAVAANGIVLGPALLSSALPTVTSSTSPASGARVTDPSLRSALTVLGAAPAPFARVIARAFEGPSGLTVAMRNGLLAYFGDASRPHAKWISLARVLSDQSSAGASYVDLRLPERPAAGFPSGSAAALPSASGSSQSSTGAERAATSESTVAALAARLAAGAGPEGSASGREGPGGSTSAEAGTGASSEPGGSPTAGSATTGSVTPGSASPGSATPESSAPEAESSASGSGTGH